MPKLETGSWKKGYVGLGQRQAGDYQSAPKQGEGCQSEHAQNLQGPRNVRRRTWKGGPDSDWRPGVRTQPQKGVLRLERGMAVFCHGLSLQSVTG